MGLQKNVASQKWRVFAFDTTDGTAKTGDAANISAKIAKDWAAAAATNDVAPTEVEDGYYVFDLTQAETNADVLDLYPESSTANIQVVGVPGTIFTTVLQTGDSFARLGAPAGASVSADIAAVQSDTDDIQLRIPAALTTGTSDSGSTTTMVDAARTEADTDYWKGNLIRFTSGNISGQTRLITGFTPGSDTITFTPATTQAVATQDYEILPLGQIEEVLVLTGHTAQTGDNFARLGAPAGASVSADMAAVKVDTAATLVDTTEIGVAGAGLTAVGIGVDGLDGIALAADAVTEIVAGVWNAARATYVSAGSFGEAFRPVISGAAATGTLSTTNATTNLSGYTADQLIGGTLYPLTGSAAGERTAITDYIVTNGELVFDALTVAMADGDLFVIG